MIMKFCKCRKEGGRCEGRLTGRRRRSRPAWCSHRAQGRTSLWRIRHSISAATRLSARQVVMVAAVGPSPGPDGVCPVEWPWGGCYVGAESRTDFKSPQKCSIARRAVHWLPGILSHPPSLGPPFGSPAQHPTRPPAPPRTPA